MLAFDAREARGRRAGGASGQWRLVVAATVRPWGEKTKRETERER